MPKQVPDNVLFNLFPHYSEPDITPTNPTDKCVPDAIHACYLGPNHNQVDLVYLRDKLTVVVEW